MLPVRVVEQSTKLSHSGFKYHVGGSGQSITSVDNKKTFFESCGFKEIQHHSESGSADLESSFENMYHGWSSKWYYQGWRFV